MFREARYEECTIHLAPGDAVLFATDGIVEAENSRGEEFGLERLIEVCAQNKNEPAASFLEHIFAVVDGFAHKGPQLDDMTAAVFRLDPAQS
jgi:sigma-B regulation protein RsbU (phosphoserine phosphatase)